MAIATNAITLHLPGAEARHFVVNATSANASGNETLKAGASGVSIYLKKVVITTEANITVTINDNTTAILGPIPFGSAGGTVTVEIAGGRAHKLTAEAALKVDASGAGNVCVHAEGWVE